MEKQTSQTLLDKRIDNLFRKRYITPSKDFTAKVLAAIKADGKLSEHSAVDRPKSTHHTI